MNEGIGQMELWIEHIGMMVLLQINDTPTLLVNLDKEHQRVSKGASNSVGVAVSLNWRSTHVCVFKRDNDVNLEWVNQNLMFILFK